MVFRLPSFLSREDRGSTLGVVIISYSSCVGCSQDYLYPPPIASGGCSSFLSFDACISLPFFFFLFFGKHLLAMIDIYIYVCIILSNNTSSFLLFWRWYVLSFLYYGEGAHCFILRCFLFQRSNQFLRRVHLTLGLYKESNLEGEKETLIENIFLRTYHQLVGLTDFLRRLLSGVLHLNKHYRLYRDLPLS